MELKVNKQFYECLESEKYLIVHEGGSRSGKTYAILQYLFFLALSTDANEKPLRISIVRKYLPSLKRSTYYDFIQIVKDYGYYDEVFHNRTDLIYILEGHMFEFFAVADEPQKLRSLGRDILYINEALEFSEEEFRQLKMRTTTKIIIDYNPSESEHWAYDRADEENADLFVSTYHDNAFLTQHQVEAIEDEQSRNPAFWRVFGEGKRAKILKGRIYSGWIQIPELPEHGEIFYGLDFGFHPDPTALVKCVTVDQDKIYVKELIYSTKVMEETIIKKLTTEPNAPIYCDHNQPQIREALRRAGFDARLAKKGSGSLSEGINFVKRAGVYVTEDSPYTWTEYGSYSWKKKKGFDPEDDDAWEQVPEDRNNHAMDAIRMGYYSHYFVKREFFVI